MSGVGRGRRQVAAHDHLRHGEGQEPLGAGERRDPLVGVHPLEGHARRDRHELRHRGVTPRLKAMGLREAVLEGDRGEPGLHEVGAEGDDVLRGGEIVGGNGAGAEGDAVPFAQRFEGEGLVGHVPAPDLLHPFVHQVPEARRLEAREEHDALAVGVFELGGQPRKGFVPRNLDQMALRVPAQGIGHAVGIVEPLQGGLAHGAEPAPVDGRRGIALDLDGAAFTGLHDDAAARSALAAGAGIERGNAGNFVL